MDSEMKFMVFVGGIFVLLLFGLLVGPCVYDYNRRHVNGNQKVCDTSWRFDYADIYLPDGKVKTIEIETWNDYDGEQIQIHSKDGTNYLISSFNTILRGNNK